MARRQQAPETLEGGTDRIQPLIRWEGRQQVKEKEQEVIIRV